MSRVVLACVAALLVVVSAPWSQQLSEAIALAWPAQFRTIAISATAVPVAIALLIAILRITDRRPLRYSLLALGLGLGAAYIVLGAVGFLSTKVRLTMIGGDIVYVESVM